MARSVGRTPRAPKSNKPARKPVKAGTTTPTPPPTVASVYFVDGCVIERDYVYVTSRLDHLDPAVYDHSRLFFFYRGQWIVHDLDWDVKSVCLRLGAEKRQGCALSLQGDVELQQVGAQTLEKIPGAGTYDGAGGMMQIREIGGELVACGYGGQVYHRGKDGWIDIASGLRELCAEGALADLCSIDGASVEDLYAVGFHGRVFHRMRDRWTELASTTNSHLERVRWHEGWLHACGKAGTIVTGDRNGLRVIANLGVTEDFWGIEVFQGRVYLAGLSGLFVIDGDAIVPLATGLAPEIRGYRLDARDGVLWSFGAKDLAFFDGTIWQRVVHPDN